MKKTPILLGLLDILSFERPERSYPSLAALSSNDVTAYMSAAGSFDGSPAAHLSDMGMSFFFAARSIDLPALRELFPRVGREMAGADCGEGFAKLYQALYSGIACGEFDIIVFAVFGEPDAAEFEPFMSRVRSMVAAQGCIALFSSRFPAVNKDMLPLIVIGADVRLKPGKTSGLFPTIFDLMGLNPPSGSFNTSLIAK